MIPSGLPTVSDFYPIIVDAVFADTGSYLDARRVARRLARRGVRFERLMEELNLATRGSGKDLAQEVISSMCATARPNENHEVIAELITQPNALAVVLTTNFDDLINAAGVGDVYSATLEDECQVVYDRLTGGGATTRSVVNLHGTFTDPNSIMARMTQVGKPLPGLRGKILEWVVRNCQLVFVGYSRSDDDINHYLSQCQFAPILLTRDGSGEDNDFAVELDPFPSLLTDANAAVRRAVAGYSPSWRQLAYATIVQNAGQWRKAVIAAASVVGTEAACEAKWVTSQTLARVHMYEKASAVAKTIDSGCDYLLYSRARRESAFYQRHLGHFSDALHEFQDVRKEVELALVGKNSDELRLEIASLLHAEMEVELVSSLPGRPEAIDRTHRLAEERERVLATCLYAYPLHESELIWAEVAAAQHEFKDAKQHYVAYMTQAQAWSEEYPFFVVGRLVVALVALGQRKEAIQIIRRAIRHLPLSRGIVVRAYQVAVSSTYAFGRRDPDAIWASRRRATKWYRRLERVRLRMHGHKIRAAIKVTSTDSRILQA